MQATHPWFRPALAAIGLGLARGGGIVVIAGGPGAGKSRLLACLAATLDRSRVNLAVVPAGAGEALVDAAARGFGCATDGTPVPLAGQLHTAARAGRRNLLLIDRAEALTDEAGEALRLLADLRDGGGHRLLTIVLLARPALLDRLARSSAWSPLAQRVVALHTLAPPVAERLPTRIAA